MMLTQQQIPEEDRAKANDIKNRMISSITEDELVGQGFLNVASALGVAAGSFLMLLGPDRWCVAFGVFFRAFSVSVDQVSADMGVKCPHMVFELGVEPTKKPEGVH